MSIIGEHPEAGIRFDLDRTTTAAPWIYVGAAFTREARLPLRITVDAAGGLIVEDEAALPVEVVRRAKLLVRSIVKHARELGEGHAPPSRIRRWRAD
jgi:hypothetical protein